MKTPLRLCKALVLPLFVTLALVALSACVVSHVRRDIPPPGGCDQCHRGKIAGNWELAIRPVSLGSEGGVPEASDIVLREVRNIPYHRDVPSKRLEVFAASAPVSIVGNQETGIQCFVCHRSPDALHGSDRGQFHHPWQKSNSPTQPE